MGIFSSIANAIFGSGSTSTAMKSAAPDASAEAPSLAPSAPSASAGSAPISRADVEAQIAAIEAKRGVKYNWRQSIVDLMKLLDLDSSLASRKELAQELGYKGALDGSAEMNIWLHKQVMDKLAET